MLLDLWPLLEGEEATWVPPSRLAPPPVPPPPVKRLPASTFRVAARLTVTPGVSSTRTRFPLVVAASAVPSGYRNASTKTFAVTVAPKPVRAAGSVAVPVAVTVAAVTPNRVVTPLAVDDDLIFALALED